LSRKNRKYKKKGNKLNKRRLFLVLFIIVFFVGSFVFYGGKKNRRKGYYVREIIINGIERLELEDVFSLSGIKKCNLIDDAETMKIIERLKGNEWIKDAHLQKCLFGNLLITIEERQPIAVLKGAKDMLLCSDGSVVTYTKGFTELPAVYIESVAKPSLFTVQIRRIKQYLNLHPIKIYFKSDGRVLVKVDGFNIIIGNNNPLPYKKKLCSILEKMKKEGYMICDMRFNNQIIFEKGGEL